MLSIYIWWLSFFKRINDIKFILFNRVVKQYFQSCVVIFYCQEKDNFIIIIWMQKEKKPIIVSIGPI